MANIIFKIRQFMAGRNGPDKLTYGLLVIYGLICFVKIFIRPFYWAYIIATVLQYAFLAYIIYRVMSKNLQKRYKENFWFEQLLERWKPYAEHMKLRLTYIKTHRFRTCRGCSEFLRLKRKSGFRTVTCPKCSKENKFFILF